MYAGMYKQSRTHRNGADEATTENPRLWVSEGSVSMSITQVGRGRWVVRWREGERHPGRTFYDKKEAEAFEKKMQQQSPRARRSRRKNLTFEEFAELWIETLANDDDYSPTTVRRYRLELEYVILPFAKRRRWTVAGIERDDLQELVAEREKQGVSKGTRAKTVTVLRAMMRFARERNFREDNPATILRALQDTTQRRAHIPTIDEVLTVASACSDEAARLWVLTMAYTGARPSEAIGLRWDHIDRETRRVIVGSEPVVSAGGEREVRTRAKTRSGTSRSVPLMTRFAELLPELELLRQDGKPWLFPGANTKQALASKYGSLPRSQEHLTVLVRRACEATGIVVKPYDIRHVFASLLITSGMPDFEVMKIIGHGSITTTTGIYGHLSPTSLDEAGALLDRALERAEQLSRQSTSPAGGVS
jgi:integrase